MRLTILLFFSLLCLTNLTAQSDQLKWKTIFDGKHLKKWEIPEVGRWMVHDGILTIANGPEQEGAILWTKKQYKDFMVELDFKFGTGTVDSGVFLRGDGPDAPQIQLGISGSLKRDMTGSPYVPKQGYPVEAEGIKSLLQMEDWNQLRIKAVGPTYTVWLNGEEVLNYTLPGAKLKGPIGLQLHANREMAIDFRNVRVAKLRG